MDPNPSAMTGNTVVISYYSGHGGKPPAKTDVGCAHDSDCPAVPNNNYPSGYYGNGICTKCPQGTGDSGCNPSGLGGVCRYWTHSSAVVQGNSTHHGQTVDWGNPSAGTAWGESPITGGWYTLNGKNAQENGGVNMVVLDQSFAGVPGLWQYPTQSVFAGLHLLALTSPTDGDTYTPTNRGYWFAWEGVNNVNGSIADAWAVSMEKLTAAPPLDGTGCPTGGGPRDGYAFGGFNGCGCNAVISFDSTPTLAAFHATLENWNGVKDDSHDATNQAYWETTYECNYDTSAYPFSN